jgi:restriction system protein
LFIGFFATLGAPPFGIILLALGLGCLLYSIVPGIVIKNKRKQASAGLRAYWQALHTYDRHKAAAQAAARDAELRKRSYWAFLDGYAFERATAEVLNRHQFNPRVTPGSGDGGIDIEVRKNGLKGVVQCKAHVSCVGPHVVRDLYGVIHRCGANFGIIVSRGGFSRGAIDFARDKPIFFLDISDLIAMQEGRDVLAAAFSDSRSAAASCDIVES